MWNFDPTTDTTVTARASWMCFTLYLVGRVLRQLAAQHDGQVREMFLVFEAEADRLATSISYYFDADYNDELNEE